LEYEKKSRNPKMSILRPPRPEIWLWKVSDILRYREGLYNSNGFYFFVLEDSSKKISVLALKEKISLKHYLQVIIAFLYFQPPFEDVCQFRLC